MNDGYTTSEKLEEVLVEGSLRELISSLVEKSKEYPTQILVADVVDENDESRTREIDVVLCGDARVLVSVMVSKWGRDLMFIRNGNILGCSVDGEMHLGYVFEDWGSWQEE